MRRLTIIVAVVIVLLCGVAWTVAHYAATSERTDPVQRVPLPTVRK